MDSEDGVDDVRGEGGGEGGVEFCGERGACDGEEEVAVDFFGEFEGFEELYARVRDVQFLTLQGKIHTFNDSVLASS